MIAWIAEYLVISVAVVTIALGIYGVLRGKQFSRRKKKRKEKLIGISGSSITFGKKQILKARLLRRRTNLDLGQTEMNIGKSRGIFIYRPKVSTGRLFAEIPVFFATDRHPTGKKTPNDYYGSERGELAFGCCWVSIPTRHTMGKLESPRLLRFELRQDPKRHVMLLDVEEMDQMIFFQTLRSAIAAGDTFMFVHGFNTTFYDAARRTGQLAYDLGISAPILYSWPSKGELSPLGYTRDETDVEWTVPHFERFLSDVLSQSGARRVHLIAHSMGNRALTAALSSLRETLNPNDRARMSEIILTAPDIDTEVFRNQIAPSVLVKAKRVTLYASSNDMALNFSKTVHGYSRVGDVNEAVIVIPGIDTVDVSPIDTALIGHSYYGKNRAVLMDQYMLMNHGLDPADRNLLRRSVNGLCYWVFRR